MGKFIITEEEKNRIRGLYEQTSTSGGTSHEEISDGIKQLLINSGFEDRYKIKDTYTKTSGTGEELFIFQFPNPAYPIKDHKVKFRVKKPSQDTIEKFRLKQDKSYPDYYMDDETSIKGGWQYWSPIFKDNNLEGSPAYKQIKYYISNIK
jgi:hypothetical protein